MRYWRKTLNQLAALPCLVVAAYIGYGAWTSKEPAPHLFAMRSESKPHVLRIVEQSLDYSCGAAALATLLSGPAADPTTEEEVLRAAFNVLSPEDRKARVVSGLSMLDLKRAARGRGHEVRALRLSAAQLVRITEPVLVHLAYNDRGHFSVVTQIHSDSVELADPARGHVRLSMTAFLHLWLGPTGQGVVLAVERRPVSLSLASP